MKDSIYIHKSLCEHVPTINYDNKNVLSYSQLSTFLKCPHRWKLKSILRYKEPPSIHLVFGTAIHEVLQEMLFLLYTRGNRKFMEYDYKSSLLFTLSRTYQNYKIKNSEQNFSTKEEMAEFYEDGLKIVDFFRRRRKEYFSLRDQSLMGIEVPIFLKLVEGSERGLYLMGYIDYVLFDKKSGRYTLGDIKTSTKGWGKYKKKDYSTTDQLVLYKMLFSAQYDIDIENIDITYFIVKRTVDENSEWPTKRIQLYAPASGVRSRNRVKKNISMFVKTAIDPETGNILKDKDYYAVEGFDGKNCKFCIFADNENLCPKHRRI